jgi:TonB-dependent SusC/RagA subfamily outer membrane receptor
MLVLPKFGETILPVAGMDSIVVKLNSARRYSYLSPNGKDMAVQKFNTQPITSLNVEELMEKYNFSSLAELLNGRVAGLNLNMNNGEVSARIRGERSLIGSNEPLVVLNGIAIGTLNEANYSINVRDIKTIEIQKDGAAWGSRGANGVIVITTK